MESRREQLKRQIAERRKQAEERDIMRRAWFVLKKRGSSIKVKDLPCNSSIVPPIDGIRFRELIEYGSVLHSMLIERWRPAQGQAIGGPVDVIYWNSRKVYLNYIDEDTRAGESVKAYIPGEWEDVLQKVISDIEESERQAAIKAQERELEELAASFGLEVPAEVA